MMYWALIRYWDEIDNKTVDEEFLVHGNTYGDATEKIVKYCGENAVERVTLELVAEDISIIPEDFDIDAYKNAQIW